MSQGLRTQKVKAVCFDLGNVLVEVDVDHAIKQLGRPIDEPFRQKILDIGQWATYDVFERGHLSEAAFWDALRSHLGIDLNGQELTAWWNSSLGELVAGVEEIMDDLIGRLPVYALSNTNLTHFNHIMGHMPLFSRFNRVIASFQVGYRKPEAQIFLSAARLMEQAPADILFIDDTRSNVEGARVVGYQAEWCDRSSDGLREILMRYGIL